MLESATAAAAATMDADSYLGPALVVVIVQSFSYYANRSSSPIRSCFYIYVYIVCLLTGPFRLLSAYFAAGRFGPKRC